MKRPAAGSIRLLALLFLVACSNVLAGEPDCTRPEAWPASIAFVKLKNAGVLDNGTVDFSKTRVRKLASEKIGKDLFRQVHLVSFATKFGKRIGAVTVSDASRQECSMSDVEVFLVSSRFDGKAVQ